MLNIQISVLNPSLHNTLVVLGLPQHMGSVRGIAHRTQMVFIIKKKQIYFITKSSMFFIIDITKSKAINYDKTPSKDILQTNVP